MVPGPDCTGQAARERTGRAPAPSCRLSHHLTSLGVHRVPAHLPAALLLQLELETQGPGAQACELGWVVCGLPGRASLMPPGLPPLPLQGNTVESEHLSELTEEEYEAHYIRRQDLKGFLWLDAKYLNPFFTRRLTREVGRRLGAGAGRAGKAHVPGGVGVSSHSAFSPSQA